MDPVANTRRPSTFSPSPNSFGRAPSMQNSFSQSHARTPMKQGTLFKRTPSNSLHWPTLHRSQSSAAATRDSSRRSGVAPMNSSFSRTPLSSRGASDSVAPGSRPRGGPTLGASGMAPPLLVGIGDIQGNSLSTTVYNPPEGDSPRAMLPEECEAMALGISREVLEAEVERLRNGNRVLRTSVARARESLAALEEGMRQSYTTVEREQENITNTLMRQLARAKGERNKLLQHLHTTEREKAAQERKLCATKQNICNLSEHLKREEEVMANRMRHQLQVLQAKRQQLERIREQQHYSLHELEQLVNSVQSICAPTTPEDSSDAATNDTRGGDEVGDRAIDVSACAVCDPRDMVSFLEQEIASVEALRLEAVERAERYASRREKLERLVESEQKSREEQHQQVCSIQQQLVETSSAANELSAVQEVGMELELEWQVNMAGRSGVCCPVPKMPGTDTMPT